MKIAFELPDISKHVFILQNLSDEGRIEALVWLEGLYSLYEPESADHMEKMLRPKVTQ